MRRSNFEKPVRRQNTHIFIDDCELPNLGFQIPEIIRKAADDKQCLTWVALDHHQCFYSGGFDEEDDWYKLLNKSIEFNETELFKLEEVLRSSVEIQQFNACLACEIASCDLPDTPPEFTRRLRLHKGKDRREGKDRHKSCTAHHGIFTIELYFFGLVKVISPSSNEHVSRSGKTRSRMRLENSFQSFIKSKQGSNFHGPPIQLHEFYERDIMDYGSRKFPPNETREFRLKRYYGQFAAFIFGTIIQSGASIDEVPIVSTNYFRRGDNNAIIGALIESGHKPLYLYDKLTKFERFTSAAFVEKSKSVKSFEWEQVLIVTDLALCGVSDVEKNDLMRRHLVLVYLGCTRARSQLYIVAPRMFWELILSRLGIPENVKKYRLDPSESTFEEDSNLKYTEEEIQEIKKISSAK